MTEPAAGSRPALVCRGLHLEYATLGWNVVGVIVLAWLAPPSRSPALIGFGLDSLIEIGASTVVVWQLRALAHQRRERFAVRLIAVAFGLLATYLAVQVVVVLTLGSRPVPTPGGIAWTTATALVMLTLAVGKSRTGRALDDPVLRTEGRVTLVDALLAVAVLLGLVLDSALGWWWADPAAAAVVALYAAREAIHGLRN